MTNQNRLHSPVSLPKIVSTEIIFSPEYQTYPPFRYLLLGPFLGTPAVLSVSALFSFNGPPSTLALASGYRVEQVRLFLDDGIDQLLISIVS